jgi:hypothetical protein
MRDIELASDENLRLILQHDGFAFVGAASMHLLLERAGPLADWPAFAASWDDLAIDGYLADHGRYRRRRHAVFQIVKDGAIARKAHEPHYQSRDYNHLHGGIERWFEPILPHIGGGASMTSILHFCTLLFGTLAPDTRAWHVETHQFRIEAKFGEEGLPTPEGMHRDGVDFVLVLLIARQNIASGTTTIHSADGQLLGSFTLARTFDAALVEDARVLHGVTPVQPLDPAELACRDVLVVTFKRI